MRTFPFWIVAVSWVIAESAVAQGAVTQEPAPPSASLAAVAAHRFPQPVRVGDLIGRRVLEPLETRPVLGHVFRVVKSPAGDEIVMRYGGFLGFGGRYIAVPTDAMALLGSELEVLDFTPVQLNAFPTYTGVGAAPLGANDTIRMGLARPAH
jgi:hypothetical protein